MFVGHALGAFALVALVATRLGWRPERAVTAAVAAALFATVPDVDILYGPLGIVGASGIFEAAEAFWATGNVVHRGPTHSWPFAVPAAVAAGLWVHRSTDVRALSVTVFAALVAVATVVSGAIAGAVTVAFGLATVAVAVLASRWGCSPRTVVATAAVGFLSHPLGDLFTGDPPALLYPFDVVLVEQRILLSGDPTLHLLAAFGIEIALVWLALATYFGLWDRSLASHVDWRASLGAAYGVAALVLPAPTLETSYHFVFSVLALGVVVVAPAPVRRRLGWDALITGLAAVTLAGITYAITYFAIVG